MDEFDELRRRDPREDHHAVRRMEQHEASRGISQRVADARKAHRGNDPRAGIRAYCAGNKWLIENAKAVGNW
jgi:hypothetical protein